TSGDGIDILTISRDGKINTEFLSS
ncbi:MAG: proteasome subunit beta, partial [Metallosphaera sp.]